MMSRGKASTTEIAHPLLNGSRDLVAIVILIPWKPRVLLTLFDVSKTARLTRGINKTRQSICADINVINMCY